LSTVGDSTSKTSAVEAAFGRRKKVRWITLVARGFVRNRTAVVGLVILTLFSTVSVFSPWVSPYDPNISDFNRPLESPTWKHPMGTDDLGRDILSRVISGGRVSLQVAVLSIGIACTVGVMAGLAAGYFGRWVDTLIMRMADALMAMPGLVLVIVMVGVLGPSLRNAMLAIAILYLAPFARVVRANALSIREQEYVQAARAVGAGDFRIMLTAVLPNTLSPIIVMASLAAGIAILVESGLSFLGLGVQPPQPSWGGMLAQGRQFITLSWWMTTFPGLIIFLTVLSLNFIGDGLRESLDPRQRRR
jgi:peptide/nickel transport system permease protein